MLMEWQRLMMIAWMVAVVWLCADCIYVYRRWRGFHKWFVALYNEWSNDRWGRRWWLMCCATAAAANLCKWLVKINIVRASIVWAVGIRNKWSAHCCARWSPTLVMQTISANDTTINTERHDLFAAKTTDSRIMVYFYAFRQTFCLHLFRARTSNIYTNKHSERASRRRNEAQTLATRSLIMMCWKKQCLSRHINTLHHSSKSR